VNVAASICCDPSASRVSSEFEAKASSASAVSRAVLGGARVEYYSGHVRPRVLVPPYFGYNASVPISAPQHRPPLRRTPRLVSALGGVVVLSAACGTANDQRTAGGTPGAAGATTSSTASSPGSNGHGAAGTGGAPNHAGAPGAGRGTSAQSDAGGSGQGGSGADQSGAASGGTSSGGKSGTSSEALPGGASSQGGADPAGGTGAAPAGGGASATAGRAASGASGGANGTGGLRSGTGGTGGGGAGAAGTASGGKGGAAGGSAGPSGQLSHVFVITMENHDPGEIVGNSTDAPYINDTLLASYASASNFVDQFALSTPSEPHYVWMEAGTNKFSDHTFTGDGDASASNSTADTDHLVTQLKNASPEVTWMSYQESINSTTGACPIASSGAYAAKHDPFVFFQDVSGSPPSKTNAYCAAHHQPSEQLALDVQANTVARYAFITPDLCHDMHGRSSCPEKNLVKAGDTWLAANVPSLIDFVTAHAGVIFIVWDEGDSTTMLPFIAIGPGVKTGYVGNVKYTHGSLLKSLEEIFGVPVLSRVASENDFADLFRAGSFP